MPRRSTRNNIHWTPEHIHNVSVTVLDDADSGIQSDIDAIITKMNITNETARHIATAAVLDVIAETCRLRCDAAIGKAREVGATWNEVAIGTGYSSPGAACQRFDPKHRARQRAASARRDARRRGAAA